MVFDTSILQSPGNEVCFKKYTHGAQYSSARLISTSTAWWGKCYRKKTGTFVVKKAEEEDIGLLFPVISPKSISEMLFLKQPDMISRQMIGNKLKF